MMSRRPSPLQWLTALLAAFALASCAPEPEQRPSFLLVMSDDQSWLHTSFAGTAGLHTPAFDRLANNGVYFDNAFASAPSCTASRSALLAGQDFYRLGDAAVLWGQFDRSLLSYQEILAQQGYRIGYTGKGWGPGANDGRDLAGPGYNRINTGESPTGISSIDYAANFADFLDRVEDGAPFSFWLTPSEPHRPFVADPSTSSGRDPLSVPGFLPDDPAVRSDMARYFAEIEWQDAALGRAVAELESRGLLEDTVIIVTSDNGMPFPRAKANNYQWGVRVPLLLSWAGTLPPRRERDAVVNLIDLAPTLLGLAGVDVPQAMTGRDLGPLLSGEADADRFSFTVTGFERHIANARSNRMTYPTRAIHSRDWSLIHNLRSERWPAGEPPHFRDIDNASPSKNVVLQRYPEFAQLATGKRPELELYHRAADPDQKINLADDAAHSARLQEMQQNLLDYLQRSADPTLTERAGLFQAAPYFGPIEQD